MFWNSIWLMLGWGEMISKKISDFFLFNNKHFQYWIPKNTQKYRKIPNNTEKKPKKTKNLEKNSPQKNFKLFAKKNSTKSAHLKVRYVRYKYQNFRYYWTSILEFFRYSIILKFRYWTFSVFNTIELRYFPVFSVFRYYWKYE